MKDVFYYGEAVSESYSILIPKADLIDKQHELIIETMLGAKNLPLKNISTN